MRSHESECVDDEVIRIKVDASLVRSFTTFISIRRGSVTVTVMAAMMNSCNE